MKKSTKFITSSFLSLLFTFPTLNAQSIGNPPDWKWANSIGGSGPDNGTYVVSDAAQNAYVVGVFNGAIKLGNTQWQSAGLNNGFLAKFAPDGSLLWAQQMSSSSADGEVFCQNVTLDNAGNVVVVGHFKLGDLKIGSETKALSGNTDLFVAKFTTTGTSEWVTTVGDSGNTYLAQKITGDNIGNTYCLSNHGVHKFSPAGMPEWMIHEPASTTITDLTWSNGKLVMGGSFYEEADINGTLLTAPNEALLMIELNPLDGALSNATKLLESTEPYPGYLLLNSLLVKGADEIYLAGQYRDSITSGACLATSLNGSSYFTKGFIAKTGASGCQWMVSEATSDASNVVNKIALDDEGNLYGGGDRNSAEISFGSFALPADSKGFRIKIDGVDGTVLDLKSTPVINGLVINGATIYATGYLDFSAYFSKASTSGASISTQIFENDGGFCTISSLESDSTGIYIMATVAGKVRLGNQTLNAANTSMLMAKFSLDGTQLLWYNLVDGVSGVYRTEGGTVSYLDKSFGKFYCAGFFYDSFNYNGQTYTNPNAPAQGFFVLQIGADGSPGWAQVFPGVDYLSNVTTDNAGDVIVCGTFANTLSLGNITLIDKGFDDFFISKFDKNGNVLWAKRGGGDDIEYAVMASTDAQNNIYFAAEALSLNLDFDDAWTLNSNEGDGNILFGKLTPSGSIEWIKLYGADADYESYCFPYAIKTDSSGDTYMTGLTGRSNSFGNFSLTSQYKFNNFLAKFDPNGDPVWLTPIRKKQVTVDYNEMDIDELGNPYIAGQIRDSTFIGNNVLTLQGTPFEAINSYIARFNGADGSLDWLKSIALGSLESTSLPRAMAVRDHNSVFCGGTVHDRIVLDNIEINAASGTSGFIGLLSPQIMVAVQAPLAEKTMLQISPNPARYSATLASTEGINEPVTITIVNSQGEKVFQRAFENLTAARDIDVSHFAAGVYFLTAGFGSTTETKRLVIAK